MAPCKWRHHVDVEDSMLRVNDVSIYFSGKKGNIIHALDRISLDISAGEVVVALGASGCGKSTLLNAIAGFLPVHRGSIELHGKPVTRPGADRGVVFQRDTLLPWKSVRENVAIGPLFAGASRVAALDRARQLLDLVGLTEFSEQAPYDLSGGMRQRVGLARALATDPAIVLMDEPFGALDSLTREQMQELLISVWKRTAKTIFLITHSIEEALSLGTRIIVMSPRPGRIIARYQANFIHQYINGASWSSIRKSAAFNTLREELRTLIHAPESEALAAGGWSASYV
jgi:taurine transport system ATP-binding protein